MSNRAQHWQMCTEMTAVFKPDVGLVVCWNEDFSRPDW